MTGLPQLRAKDDAHARIALIKCACGIACAFWLISSAAAVAGTCGNATPGEDQLLWGDLHVHTAYSLDAYAYGAFATPKEAYAFAKGQPLLLANGHATRLDRPLDFAAVTDHGATYDLMYVCTDPLYADNAYCNAIRSGRESKGEQARHIFNTYLLPLVSDSPPKPAAVCSEEAVDCAAASASQWRRTQFAANAANEPCSFTALIGYEWTPSPGGRHWHRNVIYRSDKVPKLVFDYIRYPDVHSLWRQLDRHCRPDEGCDALTIPHNINWADGGAFAVESADDAQLQARARFERLAEIHQEKGNSECLPADRNDAGDDCAFERLITNAAKERLTGAEDLSPDEIWRRARSSYYRTLLGRGLAAYARSDGALNPLMLGAIGSTDTHFGTPGKVQADDFFGGISSLWLSDEERLGRPGYNPGGLVAVWAKENTRQSIFDALKARAAYATSGPRIKLRFGVTAPNACQQRAVRYSTSMGQTMRRSRPPVFTVQAGRDGLPLASVQIVKGALVNGALAERTIPLADFAAGRDAVCVSWRDDDFAADAPAYWYARVLERPSPRWSKLLCERTGLCERYAAGDRMVQQRAWSSPIWNLP